MSIEYERSLGIASTRFYQDFIDVRAYKFRIIFSSLGHMFGVLNGADDVLFLLSIYKDSGSYPYINISNPTFIVW